MKSKTNELEIEIKTKMTSKKEWKLFANSCKKITAPHMALLVPYILWAL